jgi:hypothetical protein
VDRVRERGTVLIVLAEPARRGRCRPTSPSTITKSQLGTSSRLDARYLTVLHRRTR